MWLQGDPQPVSKQGSIAPPGSSFKLLPQAVGAQPALHFPTHPKDPQRQLAAAFGKMFLSDETTRHSVLTFGYFQRTCLAGTGPATQQ